MTVLNVALSKGHTGLEKNDAQFAFSGSNEISIHLNAEGRLV